MPSTSHNNSIDGSYDLPLSSTHIEPFSTQNSVSAENEKMTGAGVEGDETLPMMTVNSHDDSSLAMSEVEINQISHQINTCNPKISELEEESQGKYVNLCPVCKVQVGGGKFLLRKHLVEKHFFKELSRMLGAGIEQCPVCEKTVKPRFSLVRHFGIVHRRVDQLVSLDINQNDSTNIAINEVMNEVEDKDSVAHVQDVDTSIIQQQSDHGLFKCSLCGCIRKSQFRLLQHYSVAHYRDELEDRFGLQFVTNNGTCPVCTKIMKNLEFYLIHMGAKHGEVLHFLQNEVKTGEFNKETSQNNWLCPREDCNSKFPNKSLLMRHLTFTHYNVELTAALHPLFHDSKSCRDCGKDFPDFQRFLLHCSVTHRLLLTYCSQSDLEVLKLQGQEASIDIKFKTGKVDGVKTYRCKLCKFEVFNNYLLKKHYTAIHFFEELSFKFPASASSGVCEICGKQYSAGKGVIQHLGVTHDLVESCIEDADSALTEL